MALLGQPISAVVTSDQNRGICPLAADAPTVVASQPHQTC